MCVVVAFWETSVLLKIMQRILWVCTWRRRRVSGLRAFRMCLNVWQDVRSHTGRLWGSTSVPRTAGRVTSQPYSADASHRDNPMCPHIPRCPCPPRIPAAVLGIPGPRPHLRAAHRSFLLCVSVLRLQQQITPNWGGLKPQKFIFSQFQRPEDQHEGVGRAGLPPQALGEHPSCLFQLLGAPVSLACCRIPLISALSSDGLFLLCLCLSL